MYWVEQCWKEQHVPHGWTAGDGDDDDDGEDDDHDDDGDDHDDDGDDHDGDDHDDDDDGSEFLSLQVVLCYSDNEPIQFIYDTRCLCPQLSPNFIVKMRTCMAMKVFIKHFSKI